MHFDQARERIGALNGGGMERAFWMVVGAALVLLSGCGGRTMSYDELDATRANALNALSRANAAIARVEELEARVDDLESR